MIIAPRFTEADAQRAFDEWGCNCGPSALAAIGGLTLAEVRPLLVGFDAKRYTNPTMMRDALGSVFSSWKYTIGRDGPTWPRFGLARIQWEGPWTLPGVPMRARYRYTHWVGSKRGETGTGVFDINAINNGSGWVSLEDWTAILAPAIAAQYKRSSGAWHITHAIEVGPRRSEPTMIGAHTVP
jgi:hypothetical protein